MSYSENLDRYREDKSIRGFINNYKALVILLAFLIVVSLIAVVVDFIGYSEVAGMIISWNVLITGVIFVFAVIPLYAIRFLPSYHKF